MVGRCLWMLLLSLPAIVTAAPLTVTVDTTTAEFNVSLNKRLWLRGTKPTAGWGGDIQELQLDGHNETNGTHSILGDYKEIRFFWTTTGRTPVQTAFQLFDDGNTVLLVQVGYFLAGNYARAILFQQSIVGAPSEKILTYVHTHQSNMPG